MVVEKTLGRLKCDASGCNNMAQYTILNKKFIFDGNVYLCEDCMKELYGEIGKYIVPKSIKPIYKNGGKNAQN